MTHNWITYDLILLSWCLLVRYNFMIYLYVIYSSWIKLLWGRESFNICLEWSCLSKLTMWRDNGEDDPANSLNFREELGPLLLWFLRNVKPVKANLACWGVDNIGNMSELDGPAIISHHHRIWLMASLSVWEATERVQTLRNSHIWLFKLRVGGGGGGDGRILKVVRERVC